MQWRVQHVSRGPRDSSLCYADAQTRSVMKLHLVARIQIVALCLERRDPTTRPQKAGKYGAFYAAQPNDDVRKRSRQLLSHSAELSKALTVAPRQACVRFLAVTL